MFLSWSTLQTLVIYSDRLKGILLLYLRSWRLMHNMILVTLATGLKFRASSTDIENTAQFLHRHFTNSSTEKQLKMIKGRYEDAPRDPMMFQGREADPQWVTRNVDDPPSLLGRTLP